MGVRLLQPIYEGCENFKKPHGEMMEYYLVQYQKNGLSVYLRLDSSKIHTLPGVGYIRDAEWFYTKSEAEGHAQRMGSEMNARVVRLSVGPA